MSAIRDNMDDHAPLLERAFEMIPRDGSCTLEACEGRIPDFMGGVCYLIGPSRFKRGRTRYRHWLDGDGMACALRFDSNGVRLTNRFVRSRKWESEEKADGALFKTFGTGFPGDRLNARGIGLESPVNVSLYPYGQELLAFGEQGLPWSLDPVTLETRGQFSFRDRLNEVSPFSAHPKLDPETGELFNFGVSFSALRPSLAVYRFDARAELILRKRHPLDWPCSIHDFGLSPNYTCFYISPYLLDMERLTGEGGTLMDALDWQPGQGSWLMIAARESGGQRTTLRIGSAYCLHFINCWEGNGLLMVDVLELDEPVYPQYQVLPDLFQNVGPGRPVRYCIDTDSWELRSRIELEYDSAPDFPAIDPRLQAREYDDFWMLGISATGRPGRKFFDQLVRCRWSDPSSSDIYQAPRGHYLGGEPLFVPDPSSQRGAVVCQSFDAENRQSSFLIFKGEDVRSGPVARLPLPKPIPPLFHSSYRADNPA